MLIAVIAFIVCLAGFMYALIKHIHRNDGLFDYEKTDWINDGWLLLSILLFLAGIYAFLIGSTIAGV